jgi:hypothetical protein
VPSFHVITTFVSKIQSAFRVIYMILIAPFHFWWSADLPLATYISHLSSCSRVVIMKMRSSIHIEFMQRSLRARTKLIGAWFLSNALHVSEVRLFLFFGFHARIAVIGSTYISRGGLGKVISKIRSYP